MAEIGRGRTGGGRGKTHKGEEWLRFFAGLGFDGGEVLAEAWELHEHIAQEDAWLQRRRWVARFARRFEVRLIAVARWEGHPAEWAAMRLTAGTKGGLASPRLAAMWPTSIARQGYRAERIESFR